MGCSQRDRDDTSMLECGPEQLHASTGNHTLGNADFTECGVREALAAQAAFAGLYLWPDFIVTHGLALLG